MIPTRLLLGTIGALALTGCAGPISVKDMAANPSEYSARYFSLNGSVSDDVKKHVSPAGSEPLGFKTMKITGHLEFPVPVQPAAPSVSTTTTIFLYNDSDNGLVRSVTNVARNGLPASVRYALSYRNAFPLVEQGSVLANTVAPTITSAREITSWPGGLAHVGENKKYSFKYKYGFAAQAFNFRPGSVDCTTATFYSASQFNPAISGKAIDMDCTATNANGVVGGQSKHVFLIDYGIILTKERSTSAYTTAFVYDKFEVQ